MKNHCLIVTLLYASIICGCSSPSSKVPVEPPPVQAQNDLPKLVITSLDKSTIDLHALKEKVVIILFQPDCDHCQREAKEIRENLDAFRNYNLYFISADQTESVKKFGDDYDLAGHANVHFALTTVENVIKYFGAIPAPSVYIYSDQKLVKEFIGQVNIDRILQAI